MTAAATGLQAAACAGRSDWGRRSVITCADCGLTGIVKGRGLCTNCYERNRTAGTLHRYPRKFVPSADLVEDWEFLRRQGYTRRLAAERMGISKKRLEKAIERQRRQLAEAS